MSNGSGRKSASVLIELGSATLRLRRGEERLELPLERGRHGLLRPECVSDISARLREFMGPRRTSRLEKAWCALGARGVSLRRLSLPAQARDNIAQLLALQIESEFPLPPEELAWGYMPLAGAPAGSSAKPARQDFLVAAVKKNVFEQYETLLKDAGLEPVFTLSAAVIGDVLPADRRTCAVLDVGADQSEWTILENGIPVSVRTLGWGENHLLEPLTANMGTSQDDLEDRESRIHQAARDTLSPLLPGLMNGWPGRQVFVAAREPSASVLAKTLTAFLGDTKRCDRLDGAHGAADSPVLRALHLRGETNGERPALQLQSHASREESRAQPAPSLAKWGTLAAFLVLGLISLRYVEPASGKSRLERNIALMQSMWERRPDIDRELMFLQHLKTNQPPFLEVLSVMAEASGRGAKLDSLTLTRRGEMSLKGVMPNSKQAGDFRSKLIDSGWFSSVVLEEQTPIQNQPKVNVRLSGRWRPVAPANPASPSETEPAESTESTPTADPDTGAELTVHIH